MQEFGLKSWALVLAIAVAGSNSEAGEETAEFHLELGMVYANHQMYDKAIAAFTKAIELDSRYAYAFIWRAESHFAIGKHSKAICDLIDAARLAPYSSSPFVALGELNQRAGAWDLSLPCFDRALEIEPQDAFIYAGRAKSLFAIGSDEAGIADLTKAIELEDSVLIKSINYGQRAAAHLRLGQTDEALADFTTAIQTAPSFLEPDALASRAEFFFKQDRLQEALQDLNDAIGALPSVAEYRMLRAKCWTRLDEPHKALADLDKAISKDDTNIEAYELRAGIHESLQNVEMAVRDRKRAEDLKLAALVPVPPQPSPAPVVATKPEPRH